MDPLSISTASASLVLAVYKASKYIHEFMEDAKTVDSELKELSSSIDSLLTILNAMKNIFDAPGTQPALKGARDVGTLLGAVKMSIDDCMATAQDILEIFVNIRREKADSKSFFARGMRQFKLNSKQVAIDKINARILAHKTNMQLSLQTINVLVSCLAPERMTDVLAPKMDELRGLVKEMRLDQFDRDNNFDALMMQHTEMLHSSAKRLISRQSTLVATEDEDWMRISRSGTSVSRIGTNFSSVASDSSVSRHELSKEVLSDEKASEYDTDLDSDEEMEADLSVDLLQGGMQLCDERKYAEAEATLRNSIQDALRKKLQTTHRNEIKKAQLKLGIASIYLNKLDDAEPILRGISALSLDVKADAILALEALYYLSQISLAKYDFTAALRDCQKAVQDRKKLLGKTDPAYLRAIVLLVLIYKTSGDNVSANAYLKRVPPGFQGNRDGIAVLKYTAEGMWLSIYQEQEALKLLKKEGPGADDPTGGHNFRWAAFEGHLDIVKLLLWDGAPIESTSMDKGTALSAASGKGHAAVVDYLIRKGANINVVSRGWGSPLRHAAWFDHVEVCRLLLDAGAEIDGDVESGWSTVMGAACQGSNKSLQLLLDRGGSAEVKNTDHDRTALMYAARDDHPESVELLLKSGADPNRVDNEGQTALTFAIKSGNEKSVRHLLEYGASVEKVDSAGSMGSAPLCTAAAEGNTPVVKMLLEKGADVNATNGGGATAVWYASGYTKQNDVLKLLLEKGADVKNAWPGRDREPTALYRTIDCSNDVGARLLIEAGVDVNEVSYEKSTPLFMATARHMPPTIQLLKEKGAQVEPLVIQQL